MMIYFATHLSLSLLVKEFLKLVNIWQVTGKMVIISCAPFTLHFCPQRCWSRRISWITCVLQTETVTNRCYINRQINVSLLSTNIKLPGITFAKFALLSSDDVASAIAWLPDKSSAADPISVLVLKGVSDVLRPFLAHLFSQTLATCCVPASFKNLFVTPILKKSGLD